MNFNFLERKGTITHVIKFKSDSRVKQKNWNLYWRGIEIDGTPINSQKEFDLSSFFLVEVQHKKND
jgi:hypothetical protein